MKARVTDEGVLIPKTLLGGVEEVEIRKEEGFIVILLTDDVTAADWQGVTDPILGLGLAPVECGAADASENLDHYLYAADE